MTFNSFAELSRHMQQGTFGTPVSGDAASRLGEEYSGRVANAESAEVKERGGSDGCPKEEEERLQRRTRATEEAGRHLSDQLAQLAALQLERKALADQCAVLQRYLDVEMGVEAAKRRGEIEAEMVGLTESRLALRVDIEKLKRERTNLETELASLPIELKRLSDLSDELLSREAKSRQEEARLSNLAADLAERKRQVAKIEKSIKPRNERLTKSEGDLERLETRMKSSRAKVRKLNTALADCNKETRKLKRTVARLRRSTDASQAKRPRSNVVRRMRSTAKRPIKFDDAEMSLVSPLSKLGYGVGKRSDLAATVRRKLLTAALSKSLPRVGSVRDMQKWGENGTQERLGRIAYHINWLISSRAKHPHDYSKAIADWKADLRWLRFTYYSSGMYFDWPS